MPQPQLGKMQLLNLRDLWKHEERDFTPWLAEHIEELSALLQFPIVADQIEHKVGSYELDMLGHVEESDAIVIIENQLQATDHTHLGQLITYAAGLEATIVVWIAPEVKDEHRAAVEWLNKHTGDKVSFFLVRPEVFRIDNSSPAIRFHLEAGPSEFSRRLRSAVEKEDSPRHEFRRKFWEDLFQYLAAHGHPWAKGRATTKDSWISSSVGRSGIGVNVSMAQGSRMRVEIYCATDPEKQLFHTLHTHKDEIEPQLCKETVSWEPLEGANASRVAVYRAYEKSQVAMDTPQRRELFAWISKNLTVLRSIAKQYLVARP